MIQFTQNAYEYTSTNILVHSHIYMYVISYIPIRTHDLDQVSYTRPHQKSEGMSRASASSGLSLPCVPRACSYRTVPCIRSYLKPKISKLNLLSCARPGTRRITTPLHAYPRTMRKGTKPRFLNEPTNCCCSSAPSVLATKPHCRH